MNRKELADSIYDLVSSGMTLEKAVETMLEQHERDISKKYEERINSMKASVRCCYPYCSCPFDSPGDNWCLWGLKRLERK